MTREFEQSLARKPKRTELLEKLKLIGTSEEHFTVVIGEESYFGFNVTRKFLERALAEGSHHRIGVETKSSLWERDLEIIRRYIKTPETLKQLGQHYGLVLERIRQIVKGGLVKLWFGSSPQTQKLFPIQNLLKFDQETRSQKYGRAPAIAAQMLREGRSPEEIFQFFERNFNRFCYIKGTLKRWGLDLSLPTSGARSRLRNQEIARKLADPYSTDETVQEILDRMPKDFLNNHSGRKDKLLISIREVGQQCGINHLPFYKGHLLVESLREAGIPVGELPEKVNLGPQQFIRTYHFIARQHLERAKRILLGELRLQRYKESPVKQVAGPETNPPSLGQRRKRQGVIPMKDLFAELGINLKEPWATRIGWKRILSEDCPVPIFFFRKCGYFFFTDQKELLKKYIRKTLFNGGESKTANSWQHTRL